MPGLSVTPASSLLAPTNGLLAGVAEGAKGFLDAFHQAKMDQLTAQQQALQNNLFKLQLFNQGLQQNPTAATDSGAAPFSVSPDALRREQFLTQLGLLQKTNDTSLQALGKQLENTGGIDTNTPQAFRRAMGVDNLQIPDMSGGGQQAAPPSGTGLLPPGTSGLLQPSPASTPGPTEQPAQAAPTGGGLIQLNGGKVAPAVEEKILGNDLKQRDLNDPTKRQPQPAQDRIKEFGQKDTDLTSQYAETVGRYKIVADPNQPSRARFDAAIQALQDLTEKGNMPRGPAFEKLTSDLKRLNLSDPGKIVGRDFDAVATTLKNALGVMGQKHQFYVRQESAYGYTPPKAAQGLPQIPQPVKGAAPTGGRAAQVQGPDGRIRMIPSNQVQAAIAAGGKLVQ